MGLHIRRQAPVGRYIVDFICFSRKIIIEADGGQHNLSQHAEQDRIRDNFLRSQGYDIIRFWNSDIDDNLDGVMEVILSKLSSPTPTGLRRSTLPTRGRDKIIRAGFDNLKAPALSPSPQPSA